MIKMITTLLLTPLIVMSVTGFIFMQNYHDAGLLLMVIPLMVVLVIVPIEQKEIKNV